MNSSDHGQRSCSGTVRVEQQRSKLLQQANVENNDASPAMRHHVAWVRSSLSQLAYLGALRSVDAEMGRVVDFAIRWAPFGGASSDELLVAFGVERSRFLEMVRTGLEPRRTDNDEARSLKGGLLDALAVAWAIDDALHVGSARC